MTPETSFLVSDCGRSRSYPRITPGPTSIISPSSPLDPSVLRAFLLRRHLQQHHIPTINRISPTAAGTPTVAIFSGDIAFVVDVALAGKSEAVELEDAVAIQSE